jgi:hypothetical protein
MASNYGLLHRSEIEILRRAGARQDLDRSMPSCRTHRRLHRRPHGWHAEQSQALRGYAVVAADVPQRFEATAAAIGSNNWLAVDAMVDAALKRRRVDIAIRLLDAADGPGWHQERLRQRRAELAAVGGDPGV